MWVVQGKTIAGKTVEYKVPVGKDTDKAFVMALAFQDHGKVCPDDALTAETDVVWTSDNVATLPTPIILKSTSNYAIHKRVGKGEWTRHSARGYRSIEAGTEALESAASEYPNDRFRMVATKTDIRVIAVSKNAFDEVAPKDEDPKGDEAPKGDEDVIEGQTVIEVKTPEAVPEVTPKATPKRAPRKPAAKAA